MKRILYLSLLTGTLLLLLNSCKSKKELGGKPEATANVNNMKQLRQTLIKNQLKYKWIQASSSADIEAEGFKFNTRLNLKLRQDSLVWGSATYLIEVARFLATNDSAVLLVKPKRSYVALSKTQLTDLLSATGRGVSDMQDVLLAQLNPTNLEGAELTVDPAGGLVVQKKERGVLATWYLNDGAQVTRLIVKKDEKNQARIDYSDYQLQRDHWLPGQVALELNFTKDGAAQRAALTLSDISYQFADEEKVPFSIPNGYSEGF